MIKNLGLTIVLMFMIIVVNAQCFIKSTDQNSGHVTYYIDPELVAQTGDIGIALSVQMVGNNYYLAVTYQFSKKALPLEEKIAIELKNGYILELDMYTMQGTNASGIELTLAVFNLEPEQMDYFTKSEINSIQFKDQNGSDYSIPATSNNNVLLRQLKCFGK